MKINNKIAKKLKRDFPIFKNNKGLIYLDNAATTQKPQKVINSVKGFYEGYNSNIHRSIYGLSEKATKRYMLAHKVVAKLINAEKDEIIFTRSSTESLNFLSYTISSIIKNKKKRNEIVLTEMEHHSNIIPWQQMAKRNNMKLKFIKIKSDFTLDLEDAKKKITNKTAILSMVHVSNTLGTINPVKKIVELANSKGALTIIDAAQSIPRINVDVKKINCDFLVFSGHKILAPTGIGVLYGKKDLLLKLKPFNFGGGMIESVSLKTSKWNDLPMKFEAGTPNISGAIGLIEAIKYLKKIKIEDIEKWEKKLLEHALKKLSKIEGIEIYSADISKNSGILSFNIKGIHPHDISYLLNEEGIAIRGGHHCTMPLIKKLKIKQGGTCRLSFYFYNTFEDINKLTKSLKKIKRKFK